MDLKVKLKRHELVKENDQGQWRWSVQGFGFSGRQWRIDAVIVVSLKREEGASATVAHATQEKRKARTAPVHTYIH